MSDLLSRPVSIDEVAAIVRARLTDLGRGQTWLGAEIAAVLKRDEPFRQTTVSSWMRGDTDPTPEIVFAMERVLGLRPGDLSRHLGYMPVSVHPAPVGVEQAIAADPKLSARFKRALIATYREFVD